MRYQVLATDYDGTLAHKGVVDGPTREALRRLRESGRALVLVTGRLVDDWLGVFPEPGVFDLVAAENGAVLYRPGDGTHTLLAEPPPPGFVEDLRARGVDPIEVGRVIVASKIRHLDAVRSRIEGQGLHLRVTLNRGSFMVLPPGVDKATGLAAALAELGVEAAAAVGVGDGENDEPLLAACGLGAAVADADAGLRSRAGLKLDGGVGVGVVELIGRILADDLGRR